ncbi:MAG: molybdate ABC transporter substrate-binding protein [Chloroflexota bacterium]
MPVLAGLVLLVSAYGCAAPEKPSLYVFAGSSSKAALEVAARAFEAETGIGVYLNIGSSGTLLSQIELTKRGDLYLPASPDYIEKAAGKGVIFSDTEVKTNYLVPAILVQEGNPRNITGLPDLAGPGLRIAICDPQNVPAGRYAYEILDYNNLLAEIGNNIVTYSGNNEEVSSLVILQSVDAAIAWDNVVLQRPDKLDVVYLQPYQVPRLSYMSGAIITYTEHREMAQRFLDFLVSPEGRAIFRKNGYYTAEAEARRYAPDAEIGGEYKLPADYRPLVK